MRLSLITGLALFEATLAMIAGSPDAKHPGYQVILHTLDKSYVFPNFDKLPAPDTVLKALDKAQPVATTNRGTKNISIQMQ